MPENNTNHEYGYNPNWFKELSSRIALALISKVVKNRGQRVNEMRQPTVEWHQSWEVEAQRRANDPFLSDEILAENQGDSINIRALAIRIEKQTILVEKIEEIKLLTLDATNLTNSIVFQVDTILRWSEPEKSLIDNLKKDVDLAERMIVKLSIYIERKQLKLLPASLSVLADSELGKTYDKAMDTLETVRNILRDNIRSMDYQFTIE